MEKLPSKKLNFKTMPYKGEFTGTIPHDQFPSEKDTGASLNTGTCELLLQPELHKKLLFLSSRYGTTEMITMLSAFKVLLYRYAFHEEMEVEWHGSVSRKASS